MQSTAAMQLLQWVRYNKIYSHTFELLTLPRTYTALSHTTTATEILTYEAIRDGKFPVQCEMVLFIDAIKSFVRSCSGVLLQKKIRLIFESLVQEDASNKYYGYFDTRKMEQVIRNIIFNSVKFTPSEGQITIQFSHEEEIHPPYTSHASSKVAPMPDGTCMFGVGSIVIRITDIGVGIDPQNIPKLFGQFVQFDANDLQSILLIIL